MPQQTTSTILMVRPANFGFNPETAESNFYQKRDARSAQEVNTAAQKEFDAFVSLLEQKGVDIIVVEDTVSPAKTDAVFPNNWFSTHQNGKVVLYPMFSPNRREERRMDIMELLMKRGFQVDEIVDLTFFEKDGQFLEGTGSLILDRVNKVAYACKSVRTHEVPMDYFCRLMGYHKVMFDASQSIDGIVTSIYHTNVMMHIGSELAIVCLDSISVATEKLKLQEHLEKTGKKMIPITEKQKFNFAGNMLEVKNKDGAKITVMSKSASESLGDVQLKAIKRYTDVVVPDLSTIEKLGGGSARCMMAEIFLPSVQT